MFIISRLDSYINKMLTCTVRNTLNMTCLKKINTLNNNPLYYIASVFFLYLRELLDHYFINIAFIMLSIICMIDENVSLEELNFLNIYYNYHKKKFINVNYFLIN